MNKLVKIGNQEFKVSKTIADEMQAELDGLRVIGGLGIGKKYFFQHQHTKKGSTLIWVRIENEDDDDTFYTLLFHVNPKKELEQVEFWSYDDNVRDVYAKTNFLRPIKAMRQHIFKGE